MFNMAQRHCIAAARRIASQHERIWVERSTLGRTTQPSLRRQQQRSFSRLARDCCPTLSSCPRIKPYQYSPRPPLIRTRPFSSTKSAHHGDLTPPKSGFERHVTFIDKEGQSHTFAVADGDNLLDIAQANDLEMEGACGGSCACSTCHVIVADGEGEENSADAVFDRMEEPSDDENDMLDLAFGLTETSRLGCQIIMSKELDGLVVSIPEGTSDVSRTMGWQYANEM